MKSDDYELVADADCWSPRNPPEMYTISDRKAAEKYFRTFYPTKNGIPLDEIVRQQTTTNTRVAVLYSDVRPPVPRVDIEIVVDGRRVIAQLRTTALHPPALPAHAVWWETNATLHIFSDSGVFHDPYKLTWFVGLNSSLITRKNGLPLFQVEPQLPTIRDASEALERVYWNLYVCPCLAVMDAWNRRKNTYPEGLMSRMKRRLKSF